jgi:AcrR family transcriptional regulator
MTRSYRKSRRAEALDETRARILRATMALHVEQGVATTSYPEVAARAGVGAATVYRHFPTIDTLVEACGAHIWDAIDVPTADRAAAAFAGLTTRAARLGSLAEELDAFYARAEAPLWSAVRDQDRIAPLARFLAQIGKAVGAFIAVALEEKQDAAPVRVAAALADFTVWRALSAAGLDGPARREILVIIIEAALTRAGTGGGALRHIG